MNKLLVGLFFLFPVVGWAQDFGMPITKVEGAVLRCEQKGGGYAFNREDKRVWSVDPGVEEGLEHEVVDFAQKKRVPYDWRVLTRLTMMGSTAEFKFETNSKTVLDEKGQPTFKVTLDVSGRNSDEDDEFKVVVKNMPCQVLK